MARTCEIEFMPVGSGSKPGDAIIIRYGEPSAYELMIVDGGTLESGQAVVDHIRNRFGANQTIAHVVLTHPDGDHASGLREILRELPVQNFWLHLPWAHAAASLPFFQNKAMTANQLENKLIDEYDIIAELVTIAVEKQIEIHEPFQGADIGPFRVLSPHIDVYRRLMPQFDRAPVADQTALAGWWLGKSNSPIAGGLIAEALRRAQAWIDEAWGKEQLRDGGITGASNESSVVLYGAFEDGSRILLTGDAGIWGLTWAAEYAESAGLPLQQFTFVQIPHHGSRRNIGPTILNRLVGPIQPQDTSKLVAFVSAPKEDDTHPRKIVVNAFIRRGARVIATQGSKKIHYGGFPKRDGYTSAVNLPLSTRVEGYDDVA